MGMKAYGFKLLNKNGLGIKRWFNGETEAIADNTLGRLSGVLHSISIAQGFMEFKDALSYCRGASSEYDLDFIELTEGDWMAIQHPVKRFFKSLTKRLNIGIS